MEPVFRDFLRSPYLVLSQSIWEHRVFGFITASMAAIVIVVALLAFGPKPIRR